MNFENQDYRVEYTTNIDELHEKLDNLQKAIDEVNDFKLTITERSELKSDNIGEDIDLVIPGDIQSALNNRN